MSCENMMPELLVFESLKEAFLKKLKSSHFICVDKIFKKQVFEKDLLNGSWDI